MKNENIEAPGANTGNKKVKLSFKVAWQVIKETFSGFSDHKVPKLSGSLAYYTIFSMGPLLVLIISLCGLFFERKAIEGKIYGVLQDFMGSDTAMQLQEIINRLLSTSSVRRSTSYIVLSTQIHHRTGPLVQAAAR